MRQDQVFQGFEALFPANLDGGENFENLLDVADPSPARKTISLRADKHQVQERVLIADGVGQGGGDGDRFLKHLSVVPAAKRVQNQRVTDEKLILVFFDNRFSELGESLPMHPPQRVSGPDAGSNRVTGSLVVNLRTGSSFSMPITES